MAKLWSSQVCRIMYNSILKIEPYFVCSPDGESSNRNKFSIFPDLITPKPLLSGKSVPFVIRVARSVIRGQGYESDEFVSFRPREVTFDERYSLVRVCIKTPAAFFSGDFLSLVTWRSASYTPPFMIPVSCELSWTSRTFIFQNESVHCFLTLHPFSVACILV